MTFTRRDSLSIGLGAAAALVLPTGVRAATPVATAIEIFTGGAPLGTDGITLTAPQIAENGNTIPVSVDAPGAAQILILAPDNPLPRVATFAFGPLAGSRKAETRIRLATTQDVMAIAQLEDGRFVQATRNVKVTIGGCGG